MLLIQVFVFIILFCICGYAIFLNLKSSNNWQIHLDKFQYEPKDTIIRIDDNTIKFNTK